MMASTPRSSLEHLLLAQAVYQNGSSDWTVICGLLNGHPLTAYTDAHNGGWAEAVSPLELTTLPSSQASTPALTS